nr:hypothetical protein [uncultured Pedobacter sp.]
MKMIPATPEAYSITKYGQYPVSNFTGTPSISIPLYTIEVDNLKIPIDISYHAGGNKVNDLVSSIGLGWNLSAGGVISRTVMGVPDEDARGIFYNEIKAPAQADPEYLDVVANGDKDSEQDIFSYSFLGMSGKFVFGKNRVVQTVPYTDLKINFENGIFSIIDNLGRTFVFEESARNSSFSEFTGPKYFMPTSWYLTKIILENKIDVIHISYKGYNLGNIPTIDYSLSIGYVPTQRFGDGPNRPVIYEPLQAALPTKTVFYQNPEERYPDEIIFPNGRVKFKYREGRADYGVAMLDSIVVSNNNQEIVKKLSFDHDYFYSDDGYNVYASSLDKYRLKLTGIRYIDVLSGIAFSQHRFVYEEGYKLPPRNNCGVDWWGYSNGSIYNEHLISLDEGGKEYEYADGIHPKVTSYIYRPANREPDENNMKAGILKRIYYPTGGYTDFDFEPNKVNVSFLAPIADMSFMATGDKELGHADQVEFTPTESTQSATLRLNIPLWQDTKKPFVELHNLTKGTVQRFVTFPGDPVFQTLTISLTAGDHYKLIANILPNPSDPNDNTDERVLATVSWTVGQQTLTKEQKGPGLRIKNIKSYSNQGVLASFDEYKYGKNESGIGQSRFFDYVLKKRKFVQKAQYLLGEGVNAILLYEASTLEILSRPIYEYSSGSYVVAYPEVAKYQYGSNGDNGKTIFKYSFEMDDQVEANIPDPQSLLSLSWKTGDLLSEEHYKRNSDNSYTLVDERINNYGLVTIDTDYGLKVSRKIVKRSQLAWPAVSDDFYVFQYPIVSGINKLVSSDNNTYTVNGVISNKEKIQYISDRNLQPRIISSLKSDGSNEINYVSYANDYLAGTSFIDDMVANNQLNYPIEQVRYTDLGGTISILAGNITKYHSGGKALIENVMEFGTSTPVPLSSFNFSNRSTGQSPEIGTNTAFFPSTLYRPSFAYGSYTANGKPLTLIPEQGAPNSYLWDYNDQKVVAVAKNALQSDIAYTSFETENRGNWEYTGTSVSEPNAPGGAKAKILSPGEEIKKNSLNTNTEYILDYWMSGTAAPTVFLGDIPAANAEVVSTKNNWTHYQLRFKGISAVRIVGQAVLDEISIRPSASQMRTYTYKPLVGISSFTDEKGQKIYYEYDNFQRLKNVLDQHGNVIKNNTYHYKN